MANPVLTQSPNAAINKTLLSRYFQIPLPKDKVQAMYVWIDGTGEYVRAKTRTLDFIPKCPKGEFIGINVVHDDDVFKILYESLVRISKIVN